MQYLCGGELVDVELVPTELPYTVLHPSAEERLALSELHDLLWGELLGVRDNFMGVDDDGSRHLHFWPVFTFCGAVERASHRPHQRRRRRRKRRRTRRRSRRPRLQTQQEAMAASWDELDDESFGRREPSSPLASLAAALPSSAAGAGTSGFVKIDEEEEEEDVEEEGKEDEEEEEERPVQRMRLRHAKLEEEGPILCQA